MTDNNIDPTTGLEAEVVVQHPFQATKTYLCPGCTRDIVPGTGHFVVIPVGAADLRRHWHKRCWEMRSKRRPGRK